MRVISRCPIRHGKRKHGGEDDEEIEDIEIEEGRKYSFDFQIRSEPFQFPDLMYRANALLLHGSPIAHVPTARIFAYATHFDAHPMGLEWVDDNTCVLVFDSKTAARTAYKYMQKSATEETDMDGFITAKPIPIALWPPEERINKSLGKGEGLKGAIRMRWAKNDDVKKKGAKKESEFYKKHGATAGKEVYPERGEGPQKRRRRDVEEDEAERRAQLDDELDNFLAQDPPVDPPSPPSKMRSDYIATDGRTLLERTSVIRAHPIDPITLESRIMAPLPRRARGRGRSEQSMVDSVNMHMWSEDKLEWGRDTPRERSNGDRTRSRRGERTRKSQQELDDELEAFLNERE